MSLRRSQDTQKSCSQFDLSAACRMQIVNSPGVIFEDGESTMLLRDVVKSEDVNYPISLGECASSTVPLRDLI